jgi:hypothetical protein
MNSEAALSSMSLRFLHSFPLHAWHKADTEWLGRAREPWLDRGPVQWPTGERWEDIKRPKNVRDCAKKLTLCQVHANANSPSATKRKVIALYFFER